MIRLFESTPWCPAGQKKITALCLSFSCVTPEPVLAK
jgi:hypothetical protein